MEQYAILYEDEDILIANKLSPLPVQPEKSGDPSLQDLLRAELAAREGAVPHPFIEAAHRVDRRASGAVLFAKTQKSLSTVEAAFRKHLVDKEYLACVEREPQPAEGRLEHRLVWDKRKNTVRAASLGAAVPASPGAAARGRADTPAAGGGVPRPAARGREAARERDIARLKYRLSGRSERYFFLSIELLTGRHHQIRAQFAAIGCPIRGDLKYGAKRSTANGLIMLHARRLRIDQPRTGTSVEVVAPFPSSEPLWAAWTVDGAPTGGGLEPAAGPAPAAGPVPAAGG